jgi:hypothetical protein
MAGGPVRQPYAGVDFIPQSGIYETATGSESMFSNRIQTTGESAFSNRGAIMILIFFSFLKKVRKGTFRIIGTLQVIV